MLNMLCIYGNCRSYFRALFEEMFLSPLRSDNKSLRGSKEPSSFQTAVVIKLPGCHCDSRIWEAWVSISLASQILGAAKGPACYWQLPKPSQGLYLCCVCQHLTAMSKKYAVVRRSDEWRTKASRTWLMENHPTCFHYRSHFLNRGWFYSSNIITGWKFGKKIPSCIMWNEHPGYYGQEVGMSTFVDVSFSFRQSLASNRNLCIKSNNAT